MQTNYWFLFIPERKEEFQAGDLERMRMTRAFFAGKLSKMRLAPDKYG